MAGTRITIDVDDREVKSALADMLAKVGNPAAALSEIGEVLWISTRKRFEDGHGPDGEQWAPNTALTLALKLGAIRNRKSNVAKSGALSARGRRAVAVQKVLRGSGLLADTLARQLTQGGQAVEVGSNRVYAAVHQFGNPDNRYYNTPGGANAPIVPRPFLGVSAQDRVDILRVLTDYLSR